MQSQPQPSPDDARILPNGKTYSEAEVQDIYRRAAQIQSEATFERDEGWDAATVEKGANRAGISDKALLAAIKERERALEEAAKQKVIDDARRVQTKKYTIIGGGVVAVLLGISLWSASASLGNANTKVVAARAQIDNALQRRHDLVPNLLAITRQSLEGQDKLVAALEEANKNAKSASSTSEKQSAETKLTQNVAQTLATLQKENGNSPIVLRTTDQMEGAENRIAQERRRYNEAVAFYNQKASGFGPRLWHGILGYPAKHDLFTINEAARQAPRY